ncbi:MAG: type II toxin-antitoxin system VapC family toxin [Alphaproteobacteria bacterium]|nr:type II toxin-antitoxin system VapC family toxin [Alphaproteobacteria bacterium]
MTLLLDTHTILWLTEQVPRLGRSARQACDAALAANELGVPTIVFYEAGLLLRRGRVEGPSSVRIWRAQLLSFGVREVPLSPDITMMAAEFDDLHGDPLDRIIVATALYNEAVLLTADRNILSWPGGLRRQDARR